MIGPKEEILTWLVSDSQESVVGYCPDEITCEFLINMVKNSKTYKPPFKYELIRLELD